MNLSKISLETILVSLLAVGGYSLEKAWNLLPQLREADLTEPEKVIGEEIETLTHQLFSIGYKRGIVTDMMAERLQQLMQMAHSGTLDEFDALLAKDEKDKAVELLCKVKGIGPMVASTTWTLLTS